MSGIILVNQSQYLTSCTVLGPVVRRVDNFIQQINPYSTDRIGAFLNLIGQRAKFIQWIGIYPLDRVIHPSYNRAQDIMGAHHLTKNSKNFYQKANGSVQPN